VVSFCGVVLKKIITMFSQVEMRVNIAARNLSSRTAFCEGSAFSWHSENNETADPSPDEAGFGMTIY
jgi:hypothetical protein